MPIFPAEEFNPFAWFYTGVSAIDRGAPSPLADIMATGFTPHYDRRWCGRQMRCFATLVGLRGFGEGGVYRFALQRVAGPVKPLEMPHQATYGELFAAFSKQEEAVHSLSALPLRRGSNPDRLIIAIPEDYRPTRTSVQVDPALTVALHDLSLTIIEDIREAAPALSNPDHWYPGVDDGIEPVPDEHVDLVIWALQRELDRELRYPRNTPPYPDPYAPPREVRPALPLADLPRRVQRALVERRRLRYQQWGLGRKEWETGYWSLFNVPEDPDWQPPQG